MSDLRTKVTEALYEPPESLVEESAFGSLARNAAMRRARERADAVMEVVEGRLSELEAGHHYSGDPWDYGYYRALKDMRGEQ